MASGRELWILFAVLAGVTLWSWVEPFDRLTWWMESLPVFIGLPILSVSKKSFPLTRLVYYLLFAHGLLLLVGAHYTYARVPLGFWLQDLLDFSRNPYDRIGHIVQGVVPAMVAREIFIRREIVKPGRWLFFLVTCFCLAFSAFYELVEWWTAVFAGDGSIDFLGVQGDVWDAQWDMMLALIGAIVAQLSLARFHQYQIQAITVKH